MGSILLGTLFAAAGANTDHHITAMVKMHHRRTHTFFVGLDTFHGKYKGNRLYFRFLQQLPDAERPDIVLYTLNDATLTSLASVSGAFRNVRMGAAWWFNDTLNGIRRNLLTVSEYASLGTNLGMLTEAGANVIVAGSAIFKAEDPSAVINAMRANAAEHPYR